MDSSTRTDDSASPDLSRELERLQERIEVLEAARRKTEEALDKSEAMAQSIVNSALDAIITVDERGVIRAFNPAAARLFGYETADVIGKGAGLLLPASHHQELDDRLANSLERKDRTGKGALIGSREAQGQRKDGSVFPCEVTVSEMLLGSERMFTGFIRDRTEPKRIERELASKRAELERSNIELEQFASVVSHDLQEPLRMVASYAQMLGDRYAADLQKEGAEFISFLLEG